MNDEEYGTCNCCGKSAPLSRKYFYYSIHCDCCNGDKHFHIVKHCENCTPKPPENIRISLEMLPDET